MGIDYDLVTEVLSTGRPLIDAASEIDMLEKDFKKTMTKDKKLQLAVQKGISNYSKMLNDNAISAIKNGDSSVLKKMLDIKKEVKPKPVVEKAVVEEQVYVMPSIFDDLQVMTEALSMSEEEVRAKAKQAKENRVDSKIVDDTIDEEEEENDE